MQIICNNCGNELTFPNQQRLVTCPKCYTHLQIDEVENTITATVVENPDFTNPLFASLNQISIIQSFTPLYNLLHLEQEYTEAMEENFFRSLLVGKQFRPIMSRGIYRLFVGLFMIFILLTPDVFSWVSILIILYGGFLTYVGIKEIIKSWQFRQFEKYYFEEQPKLDKEVQGIDLSDELKTWYFSYSRNVQEHIELREKYFYIKLFNGLKIRNVTPLLSQGLRLFTIIGLPLMFLMAYEQVISIAIIMAFIILFILISFIFIINKSNKYTSKYLTLLKRREGIIEELKEDLNK